MNKVKITYKNIRDEIVDWVVVPDRIGFFPISQRTNTPHWVLVGTAEDGTEKFYLMENIIKITEI